MQRVLSYMIILLTSTALFALAPAGGAMAASPPSANALFGMSSPDAPIQWLENTIQGSNAPASETFLSNYGIYNNNGGGSIQAGLQAVLSYYSYGMLVIGSFLLLYYLVRIIAETAHTGRPGGVLINCGRQSARFWRSAFWCRCSTGLNSGQMIVLSRQRGIGSGKRHMGSVRQHSREQHRPRSIGPLVSRSLPAAESQAVYNYFMTQVCMSPYNELLSQERFHRCSFGNRITLVQLEIQANTSSMPPSGTITVFGNGWDQTECGQMQTEAPAAITPNPGGSTLNRR